MVENEAYYKMLRRMIHSGATRAVEGDTTDLAELIDIRAMMDEEIQRVVDGLRASGWSWSEIGREAGTTKQAAQQRWGHK